MTVLETVTRLTFTSHLLFFGPSRLVYRARGNQRFGKGAISWDRPLSMANESGQQTLLPGEMGSAARSWPIAQGMS